MFCQYKHIIWDWNGTLLDDSWLCFEITNFMLSKRGMPPMSQQMYETIMRFPIIEYYRDLGFDFVTESYEVLAKEFIDIYESRRSECKLQNGANEILNIIHNSGLTQSVLSAYKQKTLTEVVENFGLSYFFDDVIGLADIYAVSKIENGIEYISRLPFNKEEILFIGDTTHDSETAQAMGVDCVLVESGHNSRARLKACGSPVFSSLGEFASSYSVL